MTHISSNTLWMARPPPFAYIHAYLTLKSNQWPELNLIPFHHPHSRDQTIKRISRDTLFIVYCLTDNSKSWCMKTIAWKGQMLFEMLIDFRSGQKSLKPVSWTPICGCSVIASNTRKHQWKGLPWHGIDVKVQRRNLTTQGSKPLFLWRDTYQSIVASAWTNIKPARQYHNPRGENSRDPSS